MRIPITITALMVLATILSPPHAVATATGAIEVTVKGLQSEEGGVAAALFHESAAKGFPVKQDQAMDSQYIEIVPGEPVQIRFEGLAPGDYAVSLFHDENGNRKLDTNFIGIPREGMAASNDAKGRFGPPRFEDARITLEGDLLQIDVQMEY